MNKLFLKPHFLLILFTLVAWAGIYSSALVSMVHTWNGSNTYNHGYLIPIIVGYLIWEKKTDIQTLNIQPIPWLVLLLLPIQFVQFIGDLSGIMLLEQLAAYAALVVVVVAIVGWNIAKVITFPLAYLVFAIPMGEEFVPQLQQITADISVWLLEVSGVPVYRDGLYIYVPNGIFEVAEACAGIRFLIASIALGTLFSYIFFQTTWKRIAFFMLTMSFPIIANGIRAYGIMMIGYHTDMEYATGADHLIYGWFFFSLVLGCLFLIGNAVKEPLPARNNQQENKANPTIKQPNKLLYVTAVSALVLVLPALYKQAFMNLEPAKNKLIQNSSWQAYQVKELGDWQPKFETADQTFKYQLPLKSTSIDIENLAVGVYIANYLQDNQDKELINWGNWQYNKDAWTISNSDSFNKTIDAVEIKSIHLTLKAVGERQRELIYWYQVNDNYSANNKEIKLAQLLDKLKGNSGAGRFVAISFESNGLSKNTLSQTIELIMSSYGKELVERE